MHRTISYRAPSTRRGPSLLTASLVLSALAAISGPVLAQTVGINGFIKSSYYYDTRQVTGVREGDFILYPAAEDLDGDGNDLNDTGNLLFFPFFSRVTLNVGDLPDAFGAKVSGVIETDFFGASNATLNSVRMRRGIVKLDWQTREAVFGMDWTPSFIETWPRVVATEAGAPFQPFGRYPQIRYTLKPEGFRLTGVVAQQRDAFAEIGGVKKQQQAGVPTMMGFAEIVREQFLLGGGAWIKWIRPELGADTFDAKAFQGYLRWTPENFAFRAKLTYGEDLADLLMTGGYLIDDDGNAATLRTMAGWVDVETTGRAVGFGIFGGYLSNLGASDPVEVSDPDNVFARDPRIESAWRVSPRVVYNTGKLRFAWELQVTSALYASGFDEKYKPDSTSDDESVTNVRGDFSVFLFF